MKSGLLTGHQTHGNLDLGDFVIDALGTRWFGELGSGQYLATNYFSNETQQSERWSYYEDATEGQNTLLIDYANQNVNANPTQTWGSSNTTQSAAPSFTIPDGSTAFFTIDMSSAYSDHSSGVKRGIRYINNRTQILIQDEVAGVASGTDIQWRANTNATVTVNSATATLVLDGQTAMATILQPSGAAFSTASATPVQQEAGITVSVANHNQTTVLIVDQPNGGDLTLSILFNPQWSGMQQSDFKTPPNVAIDSWTLDSHN